MTKQEEARESPRPTLAQLAAEIAELREQVAELNTALDRLDRRRK